MNYRIPFDRGLFFRSPAIILGIGLPAPLLAGKPLHGDAVLGLFSLVMVMAATLAIAMFTPPAPRNARTGIAILIAAGVAAMASAAAAGQAPVGTLLPLLFFIAATAADRDSYAVKGGVVLAAADSLCIGAAFTIALCAAGILRDAIGTDRFDAVLHLHGIAPFAFFSGAPGIFFLVACIILALERRAGRREAPHA